MMARVARRLTGSLAIELEHPVRLWQVEIHSSASAEQARFLLADIASERARADDADMTAESARPQRYGQETLRRSGEQWRQVAAGVAVGDAACLIALARGLAGERSAARLGEETLDAAMTALVLAARGGTAPERTVACVELLLMLPEVVGKSQTTARRARALAALFRAFKTLRWNASGRDGRDSTSSVSTMMLALATVEATAVRRGLFAADLDREALFGRFADLLAAEPSTAGDIGADEDELSGGGCVTDLLPSSRRIGPSGMGLEAKPPTEDLDKSLTAVPFPKFDPARFSDNRKGLSDRYALLKTPLSLTPILSRQAVDQALQLLAHEMPNFGAVIKRIGDSLALARCTASRPVLQLPPMLLVGPPGVGKTRFAARLAASLCVPSNCLPLAGSCDNREFAGTARGWSNSHPSWPVEQLVQLGTANPLLVIDEIDKAGGSEHNGRAVMSLLTLLERRTSQVFSDECLGGPIDLSRVSWILTANTTSGLPGPLLSRVSVLGVQAPSGDQVGLLLTTMTNEIAAERNLRDPGMLPALPPSAVDLLRAGYAAHGDPRRLRAELTHILGVAARAEELWPTYPSSRLH